jgi:hypothetical protein
MKGLNDRIGRKALLAFVAIIAWGGAAYAVAWLAVLMRQ